MRPLPEGTLTLLFSDIEGSTSLLTGLGASWGEALSAHRRIMRETFGAHRGHELGTEGDSFFVIFESAQQALQAAVEAQRRLHAHTWPAGVPLRVRMGLHTGEPQRHEDGYIGMDVHRAARIAATASGGQIVLSAATAGVVAGGLDDVELRDLGWHRLKDLPDPEHLYDVVATGLPHDHPPLRSLGTKANLPNYASALIGRSRELREISDAIAHGARLLTLTGPGGTGKTRLAVAVANELQHRLSCDIYFVPLHAADRAAVMWSGIAEAVGALGDVETLPHDRVLEFLAKRNAFLILDNLEQIPDADQVVSALLGAGADVRLLVTSRRPLHLVDEQQYPVPPLPVPRRRDHEPLDAIQTGAVDLFVRRARMVKPGFALTEANAGDVITLCRRLDGLPLAIELAAARIRLLSPKALLGRIDDRLGEGLAATDRAARQRTLRATINWSYDLLEPADQRVFRELGAFAGRFSLEAVASVATAGARDPLDVVAHLVDVSLIEIVEGPDGEPMIWLLDTIRRFAREQLHEAGEGEQLRLRHARWCLRVATEIAGLLHGPRQMTALDRMSTVEEDIRGALDWCLGPEGSPGGERQQCGFALLRQMDTYWYRFGYIAEGRGWHDRADELLDREDLKNSAAIVDALHGKGVMAVQQNDLVAAVHALERALEMANRLGDVYREARESNSLGIARRESGDVTGARTLLESSLELARSIGDRHREATALSNMVHIHMDLGDYAAAVDATRRAAAVDRALGDPWGVAINRANGVNALLNAEGPRRAYEDLREVAPEVVALGDVELTIDLIETAACIWAGLGDAELAATLLGVADRERELAGIPRAAPDQEHLDRFVDPARQSLPPEGWQRAAARGRQLTVAEAVARAVRQHTSSSVSI